MRNRSSVDIDDNLSIPDSSKIHPVLPNAHSIVLYYFLIENAISVANEIIRYHLLLFGVAEQRVILEESQLLISDHRTMFKNVNTLVMEGRMFMIVNFSKRIVTAQSPKTFVINDAL